MPTHNTRPERCKCEGSCCWDWPPSWPAPRPRLGGAIAGSVTAVVTHVRDGDTIEVGGLPIRLNGLAAPEHDEPGGAEATEAMRQLVAGRQLRCDLDGEHTHDRCVGICYLDGQDISDVMVHKGLARDCPRFSGGRYRGVELQAAAAGATIGTSYPLPGYCTPGRGG